MITVANAVWLLGVSLCGLVMGSFISLISYRLPRDQSLWTRHSRCPACEHSLQWRDLIPIVSWLWMRGQCRYCATAISRRYPLIELCSLIITLGTFLLYGVTPVGSVMLAIGYILLTMSVIDIEHIAVPHSLQAALGIAVMLLNELHAQPFREGLYQSGAALLFIGGIRAITSWVFRQESLGMADVIFCAIAGLAMPFPVFLLFLGISGLLGIIWGLAYQHYTRHFIFPFIPCLSMAFFITLTVAPFSFTLL